MTLVPGDFIFIADFLKSRSGLSLKEDKMYLLESRLKPIARVHGYEEIHQLVGALRDQSHGAMADEIVEAMTTNESMFFRDRKPFDFLRNTVVPTLMQKRSTQKSLRIWSAACSSGQEPYSLAMSLREINALTGWQTRILATDIAHKVIDKAREGVYTQFEVQRGLQITQLVKYFDQTSDNQWKVKPELKADIEFEYLNLMDSFASKIGTFDIIFCRNVLIYFDDEVKRQVFAQIVRCMNPGGMLFLGSAETASGFTDQLTAHPDYSGVFVRR